ncbi:MAG: succinylglutamate desuccinylase/aspartoacylase family protein, partial [Victivallales bacterium]
AEFNNHNMNRKWNGEPFATALGTINPIVYERYVRSADAVIDIHGWRSGSTAFGDVGTRDAMLALGLRWNLDRPFISSPICLDMCARHDGKISLLIELNGQTCVFPESVRQGVRAANNLLKFMRMLDGELELPERQFIQKQNLFIKAPEAGLVIPFFEDQKMVPSGAEYLRIVSPDTGTTLWSYRTENEMFNIYSGRFYFAEGHEPTSVVEPGMMIGHLAEFEQIAN